VIAGPPGSGKTAIIRRLLPPLTAAGLRVGILKLAPADFDPDRPGKDSYRHREAGAAQVALISSHRWSMVSRRPILGDSQSETSPPAAFADLLPAFTGCSLVLVESPHLLDGCNGKQQNQWLGQNDEDILFAPLLDLVLQATDPTNGSPSAS